MAEAALAHQLDELAAMIIASQRLVAFTGAGVSTESGIPDFRSPGGVWTRHRPITFQEFVSSHEARQRYWQMQRASYPVIAAAQPNPAHLALAELERLGKLDCIITQNIDGLHQRAGVSPERVIELHGTARWVVCLSCSQRYPRPEIQERVEAGEAVPTCDRCGGWLKPATISFGQAMPERAMREAERRASQADVLLVIGSTLVVYPAASLPGLALAAGARLAIINLSETPYDHAAQVLIRERAGVVMSGVLERIKARLQPAMP